MIMSFQIGFSYIKDFKTWRKVQIQLEVNEPKVQPSGSEKKGRVMKFMRTNFKAFHEICKHRDRISKQ